MSTSGWVQSGAGCSGSRGHGQTFPGGTWGPGHRAEELKGLGCSKEGAFQVRCDRR